MKIKQLSISLLAFILSATSMQAATVPSTRHLDFKCVEDECSLGYYVWNISASPSFPDNGIGSTLLINIGNAQTKIQVSSLIGKRLSLAILPINIENLQSTRWVGEQPQRRPLKICSFSVRLDGSEVVSWTKAVNKCVFMTRNFRVYLPADENPIGCVWITESTTKTADDNLYSFNCFPYAGYNLEDKNSYFPEEERFLRSVMGPIWVALTENEGFLSPRELVFPTVEELLDQSSFTVATSIDEYLESSSTIWERPYLLPPVLKLKAEFDNEETLRTLKSLQRDVSISRIGSRPPFDFRARHIRLLEYYLAIIDETSPLRSRIERNLEIVRNELVKSTAEKTFGGSTRNTEKIKSLPVRKQHAIPAASVEHDASDK